MLHWQKSSLQEGCDYGIVSFPESQPSELFCVALKRQGTQQVVGQLLVCIKYTEKHLQEEKIASLYVVMT